MRSRHTGTCQHVAHDLDDYAHRGAFKEMSRATRKLNLEVPACKNCAEPRVYRPFRGRGLILKSNEFTVLEYLFRGHPEDSMSRYIEPYPKLKQR